MKYILSIILLATVCHINGQDTLITERDTIITNTGKIEVDQVEVIKAFEAKLSDAKRIAVSPKIQEIKKVEKTYEYDITIVPIDIVYADPVIRPLAMNPDAPKNVEKFFARLGYGDLKSPYADLSYQHTHSDEYDFLVTGHFYGADDSEDIAFRKFYESSLDIKGGYRIGENHKLNVDLGGSYDFRNRYDILFAEILTDITNIERYALDLHSQVSFGNIETTDSGLDYKAYVNGGNLAFEERLDVNEIRFGGGFNVKKGFGSNFAVFADADASFYDLDFSTTDNELQRMITLRPGIQFRAGPLFVSAAADIFIDNEGTNPFADVEVGLSIIDNSLQIYAGVDQVTTANSLHVKYNDNPFVNALATEQLNTVARQGYGGIRGILRDFLTYDFAVGYEDIKNQRFDRNAPGALMRQTFDDMTNLFFNGNIEFNITKNISVGAIADHNFFEPATLENVINLPSYTYNAYATIDLLDDKVRIRTDLNLADQIFWLTPITEELITGNKQLDLSIGIDYYPISNVGLWVRANNLIDREYTRYHYYPGFGRNILGGLLVKF